LYTLLYPKFTNFLNANYFKYSNLTLANLYNQISRLELNFNEFERLIEQIDKIEFKEKLIAFNLLRNEPDNENKIHNFLNNIKANFNHLMEKLAISENFIKTFLDYEEKDFLNNINYKMKIKTKNIGNVLKDMENFFKNSNQYNAYKDYCNYGAHLGDFLGWATSDKHYILNIFAQDDYGRDKRYTDYSAMYNAFANGINDYRDLYGIGDEIQLTIAIPYMIGCGLAGGDWDEVQKTLLAVEKDCNVVFVAYDICS
jgi:hypothetical protein